MPHYNEHGYFPSPEEYHELTPEDQAAWDDEEEARNRARWERDRDNWIGDGPNPYEGEYRFDPDEVAF